MRPVAKGAWPVKANPPGGLQCFADWTNAIEPLRSATGPYCHLCEMRVNNHLSIEHIKSRNQFPSLSGSWTNFLLSCGYCNSRKRKTPVEAPYRKKYVWPHLHNTLIAFDVPLGGTDLGTVQPSQTATADADLLARARRLIDLYRLDQPWTQQGHADMRYIERVQAIDKAARRRREYEDGKATPDAIVDMAETTGFFSVWLKVFVDVPAVALRLIQHPRFHVEQQWFTAQFEPVPRLAPGPV